MHADAHKIREKWAAGEAVAGPFVQLPAPGLVEIFALAGYDFVVVDLEHGAFGIEVAENMMRAAHGRGIPAMSRVLANRPELICAVLNVGAAGVLVPHVDTPDEARAAVRAARFAPRGARGLCPFVRSADYSAAKGPDYYAEASEAVIVGILLEGRSAYESIDEILAIDGLDVVMIAPYDLSQSLGVPGEVDHPSVRETFQDVCARAATTGKTVGIFTEGAEKAAEWVRLGARMIGADVDSQILWHAARAEVEQFRAILAAAPA
ncbi:aldolase [Baekduia soli]|uniref:Aldolase n=1 Tax=Baekduia soli TaxID=496014 RepID=A0A5B8UCM5_9ACTN|nr:aldolase/citrate lyase family protein [Baekduia soli]QEC50421.1 aldolase [Baekduia soli]